MNGPLPLEALFLRASAKLHLGVRDYTDALEAMGAGYGIGSAPELRWLCQTLWCRSEEEERALEEIFRQIPPPSAEEIQAVTRREAPARIQDEVRENRRQRGPRTADGSGAELQPELRFAPTAQQGVGVPSPVIRQDRSETFILTPRPAIAQRALTQIWRRFRRAKRSGPRTEIDIAATVDEQCRTGFVADFVRMAARGNQARLVLLLDVSPSMAAWRPFYPVLLESLVGGRLGEWTAFYFYNSPDALYADEGRTELLDTGRDVLAKHAGSAAMVVSDGGAARGFYRPERLDATGRFLAEAGRAWGRMVWVNPLPRRRWPGSTAARIAEWPRLSMFEMDEAGLMAGVDELRGK